MLGSSFGIGFILRKAKASLSPFCRVYVRITVDGVSRELSLNYKWDPARWDRKKSRATGNREDAQLLNAFIESIHLRALEAKNSLAETRIAPTADAIVRILSGLSPEKRMLLETFGGYIEMRQGLVGSAFSENTVKRYVSTLNHLRAFVRLEYGAEDLELEKMDYAFVSGLYNWFRSSRKCTHNTSSRYLGYLKTFSIEAKKNGWLNKDPFVDFRISPKEIPVEPVAEDELERMQRCTKLSGKLAIVRDIFVFCCYTGLSYMDVKHLRPSDIKKGASGKKLIRIKRKKTGSLSRIPLLQVPIAILSKYRRHPKAIASGASLPVPSNQKTNEYLKEVTALCGIRSNITFHHARHTFATTIALANGVPIETVSQMLGHSSIKQTQHYAKVLDRKLAEDMTRLERRLSKKRPPGG